MITSVHNPKVKRWQELQQKKGRDRHRAYWIEGERIVREAIASNAPIEAVVWQSGKVSPLLRTIPTHVEQWEVSEAVFKKLQTTEQSQGIAAIVAMKGYSLDEDAMTGALFLLVDGVQDPGNLGTIIRAADAAGVDAVFLGEGTVDLYNPKTVRSTMGSLFHLPIHTASLDVLIPKLRERGIQVVASALDTEHDYDRTTYAERVAIVVGNEGSGIAPAVLARADRLVKIPIYGAAESLNVGVATALLLYEVRRMHRGEHR